MLSTTSCTKWFNSVSGSWYTYEGNTFPDASDFREVDDAINNSTVIHYNQKTGKPSIIASYSLFVDNNGRFTEEIYVYYNIPYRLWMVHFINGNTLEKGWVYGGISSRAVGSTLYSVNAGKNLGTIKYCWQPSTYTYAQEGNKIITTDGDIYTISGDRLIPDGSTRAMVKYNWK